MAARQGQSASAGDPHASHWGAGGPGARGALGGIKPDIAGFEGGDKGQGIRMQAARKG